MSVSSHVLIQEVKCPGHCLPFALDAAQAIALGGDAFLKIADDEFIIAGTLEGRPETRMAPFGEEFAGPGQVISNIITQQPQFANSFISI